ncbi:MAG: hypothetical protein CMB68_02320 [Euryarchaeota archaeon]|nr:hypothetical protein [Euryarchaeota archaeon]|tara:strand:- start:4139 stop:4543 length:405 start_codon:yes stop_codon:yes gene_type:complete
MAMRPGSRKINTVLAAWSCLILGGGIALTSDISEFVLAIAAPLAIAGAGLLLFGLSMDEESELDPVSVTDWEPDASKMPDAGRVMFRVDTTLDPPIRTSILCGRCGKVDWVDGRKPKSHTCSECNILLWESEEE